MQKAINTINIIGGGFCGTMVAYHLLQSGRLRRGCCVRLYDRAGLHGRGVAYATPFAEHLLNVPAAGMSALPHDPDDFVHWLRRVQGTPVDPTEFYSRRLYGDYLHDFLLRTQDMAHEQSVSFTLETADGPDADSDSITVIATGVRAPRWPGDFIPADERAIEHPYGDSAVTLYGMIDRVRHIAILGTGLSAVDALMSLDRIGYRGQITCVARRGLWPIRHGPKNRFWHWRLWIDSLRPYSNSIWRAMPKFLRDLALRHIGWWNILRHRMPPQCHDILRDLCRSGRMKTHRGRILSVTQEGESFAIHTDHGSVVADAVINCLGFVDVKGVGEWRDDAIVIGPPLFGRLIETTAVPELRIQAWDCAERVLRRINQ